MDTIAMVKETVEAFMDKGYMFTAWDVTKFLRNGGTKVKHNEVNDTIKSMFSNGDMEHYVRDEKDVGAPVAPFVYYPMWTSSISNYDPNWLTSNPNQDGMKNDGYGCTATHAMPTMPTMPTTASSDGVVNQTPATVSKPSKPKDGFLVTKEGRLNIPVSLVSAAGMSPKTAVGFVKYGNTIRARNYSITNPVSSVTSDGRIRVCRSTLDKISAGNLFKINVDTSTSEIVIAPY